MNAFRLRTACEVLGIALLLVTVLNLSASIVTAETSVIYLDFGPDPNFPTFAEYPDYQTSPLGEFDAADLYPGWGAKETSLLKSKVTEYIEGLYHDFGVVVTRQKPTNGQPFQTIGFDSTKLEDFSAIGLATIDSDAFDEDYARIWAGNVAAQGFSRLNDKPDDLEFWARAIGMTAVHEAGHNFGLTHCDGDLSPEEQARGESRSDHIMQAGDFGCFWDEDDLFAFWNNSFENMHFSDTSVRKLNTAFGIDVTDLIGDCNSDGKLDAADLSCVASIIERDSVLQSLDALPGDLDGQGGVAFNDFLVLAENFGTDPASYAEGNIDLNDGVEFADFLALAENFGRVPTEITAVPEPSGYFIAALALLCIQFNLRCVGE